MTITYGVERLEHDEGTDLFLVKHYSADDEEDEVIELEAIDDLMTLRATDAEAYEVVMSVCASLLERGQPIEALEG